MYGREKMMNGSRSDRKMSSMNMMKPEDEDMAMARKRKAVGGSAGSQPSYGSGEMPKAMPN
tara:strand:- start:1024 stop:1206 length:183 start_codon:yes stop_codon:yes gene_type:complete